MISATSRAGLNVPRIAFAAVGVACMVLWSCVSAVDEGLAATPSFSDAEIKIILSHGPWPTPVGPDPSNRVSGKPDAIELGTVLFFDPRLSGSGTKACVTCHVPERNWTDNLPRGIDMAPLDRNTPTLMNLRGQRWYGWDGAADSLWSQSLRPILDARELAATPRHVANLLRNDASALHSTKSPLAQCPSRWAPAGDAEGAQPPWHPCTAGGHVRGSAANAPGLALGGPSGRPNRIAGGGYTMAAQKPEDCDYLIAEYINSGNVQAAVDLYEPTATFVAEPGKPVSGHAAIREVMAGFAASKPRIEMKVPIVVQSGDLALTVSEYTITSTGPDGKQTSSSARGTEVVRRQADGTWRFVIDNPTGTA